jgi:hypothetical protein
MAVDEDVGRLDAPAVLERRLTRSATEPEVGGTLREHVVRREDQRPRFASGVVQLATPPEPADERDPGKHQNARDTSKLRTRPRGHGGPVRRTLFRD